MKQPDNSIQSPSNDGCGTMLVWYFRIAAYIGLVVALAAFIVPNNGGMAWILLIVCGGFIYLTRKKK